MQVKRREQEKKRKADAMSSGFLDEKIPTEETIKEPPTKKRKLNDEDLTKFKKKKKSFKDENSYLSVEPVDDFEEEK